MIGNLATCAGLLLRALMARSNHAPLNCSSLSRIIRVVEAASVIGSPVIGVAMQAPTPPSNVKKEPGAYDVATWLRERFIDLAFAMAHLLQIFVVFFVQLANNA